MYINIIYTYIVVRLKGFDLQVRNVLYVHTYMFTCKRIYVYICMCMHIYTYMYICTSIYFQIYMYA
jgi:hypothetical protein